MINVDLSRVFQPSSFELIIPLLPGLFFEGSLLMGRPDLLGKIPGPVASERYLLLFLATFAAFVIGCSLMLWVRLILFALWKLFRTFYVAWPEIVGWLVRVHRPADRTSTYSKWLWSADIRRVRAAEAYRHVVSAWWHATKVALKQRGIDDPGRHMDAWAGVVGGISVGTVRSTPVVMGLHAASWGGLIALRIAPALGWLYRDACFFLIFMGLLDCGAVALSVAHPVSSWRISLRKVLDELDKGSSAVGAKHEAGDGKAE